MARISRVVAAGYPHHITQRNRRQKTFFSDGDYHAYPGLMSEWCGRCGVAVWAYCLMPNHVHLVVVPDNESGLRKGFTFLPGLMVFITLFSCPFQLNSLVLAPMAYILAVCDSTLRWIDGLTPN